MHRLVYFDTSAALKLFKEEAESAALEAWLSGQGAALVITSDLTRTELRRGLHHAEAEAEVWRSAEEWLEGAALLRLTPALFDQAGRLVPRSGLRSLDAIHVCAALSVAPSVVAFVAYDKRLLDAAVAVGLKAISPA